ncbi:MAG: hypothetical protein ACFCVD_03140 [Nodosilinea sp.]
MARPSRAMVRGCVIAVLGMVCWLGLTWQAWGQAEARLESRLNRLESELGRVRSQLSRVESQLNIPSRPAPNPPQASPSPSLLDLPLEDQFDNLAILTIELKQQVRQLEERVERLEG